MTPPPHVALIVETSKHYGREILRGVGRYLQAHGPWSLYFSERGEGDSEPVWLRDWEGDGVITRSHSASVSRLARDRGIPVVNLSYFNELASSLEMPCINCDHSATGELVAKHFIERGFEQFAFCHVENELWSATRRDAFAERCKKQGWGVNVLTLPSGIEEHGAGWEEYQDVICEWIESLPKPCAIMAAYDLIGARIIDACRRVGVRVPQEIAVAGVDNDPIFCALAWPPLSSVDQNVDEIGFLAARLLGALMAGGSQPDTSEPILVSPKGMAVRSSSDIYAFDDSALAAALQFIRDSAARPISVEEVVRYASVSRRDLERRFRTQLDSSPHKEIQRARIRRVKHLLANTEETLETISATLKFSEVSNMASLFKSITGMPPGEYRRSQRNPTR